MTRLVDWSPPRAHGLTFNFPSLSRGSYGTHAGISLRKKKKRGRGTEIVNAYAAGEGVRGKSEENSLSAPHSPCLPSAETIVLLI